MPALCLLDRQIDSESLFDLAMAFWHYLKRSLLLWLVFSNPLDLNSIPKDICRYVISFQLTPKYHYSRYSFMVPNMMYLDYIM